MENKSTSSLSMQQQIDLLGTKEFVKKETIKTDKTQEDYLQIGICTSLLACLIPKFDIFTVVYISLVFGMCLGIYFILDWYKKLLKQLEEQELQAEQKL